MNRSRFFSLLCLFFVLSPVFAKTKLIVWGLQSGKETAGLDAQVLEFEKRNRDIDVSLLSMGAGAMNPQKLMTAIVGGVPPDVINQDRFTIGDWASRDTFMPLDEFLARDKNDPNGIHAKDYYSAAWQEAEYKGRVYAIPSGIDDRMLFYNRKVLREAGFSAPPQTWEELLSMAKKMTKRRANGTYERIGFIPNYGNSWLYLYAWQNGGEFMSKDGRTCTLNDKPNVQALEYMTKVYDELGGYSNVSIFQSGFQGEEQDPFFTGKIGMVINGNWVLNGIARFAPSLDFGVAPAPVPAARLKGEGRFKGQPKFLTWSGGFSLAIPRGARNTEQAWRFIKWMNSLEAALIGAAAQKRYNESKGRPFVFNFTANQRINEELLKLFPPKGERLFQAQKAFIDMLPNGKFRPVTFVGQSLWDAHVRAFEQAAQHAKSPQAAMDEQTHLVQQELDKAFAREKLPLFPKTPAYVIGIVLLCLVTFGLYNVKKQVGNSRMAKSEAIAGYLMAAPWIFGFCLLTAGPIIASLMLAFADYDVLHAPRYAGFSNFQTLFTDDRELLGKAFYNAAYLSAIGIPLGMATGLSIAMLLNMKVRGMAWYRTAFYIPSIVPAIASAVLWGWILAGDPNKGLLNALLQGIQGFLPERLHFELPGWFSVAEWAKPGLIVQGLWGAGGGMILWLAGLQGVPQTLYEAAQIDGARAWKQFRHVTLPLLSPYIFFQLIMGTIGALQEFDRVYVLGGGTGTGGPLDSLLVPVLYLFNNAFRYFKMGYASSIAWVIFVVILALTLIQLWAQKYWVHYEGEKR
jgi:ABC-type sugar transport system permease subunit/ABC-type glycerol-3-phosphate transport system substrate-binding protein